MEAATVVSVSMGVMKPVLAKLVTLMCNEYNSKFKGLHKEVTFLRRELGDMDALLEKMDNADELDPQAKKWRKDIIEMSYNIEDHIDDFMHSVGDTNEKMGIIRKASHYVKTFKDRRRLENKFQEIKTLVTEASDRRKRYMLDHCISVTTPVVVDPRMSALYKESASLVGIEAQKHELTRWALEEVKQLKMMAIVGLGGLGKTTLANEVSREIGDKFECKAFVSVSQKPQLIEIFNSLLLQLGLERYSHAYQLHDNINRLRGHLQDKRYFIVVDDLWDMQAWDAIQCSFPQSNHCSRVIVTTRIENVARSCCNSHDGYIHNMKPLSEQDSSKLFFGRIFGSEDACPTELKKASCEILKKCGGLPLAIITMASMLACQPRRLEGQWEYIQNSLDIKVATNSKYEDMMYILGLSYKNLPRHLKACFLYLGSYPEDHAIRRSELVRRWVAEGFVSSSIGQDVWDIAESYFNELVNRSMIQPTYDNYTAMASGCRVHDMLLDLIVRRCKEDNFLHLINDPEAVVEVQDVVIRRLTVVGLGDTEEDMNVTRTNSWNLSQIRSLTKLGESNWTPPLQEFKLLRILFIGLSPRATTLDLRGIVQLSQLKYLKVKCNGWITGGPHHSIVLPNQIGMLQYLETLELPGKSSCIIPKDMVHLSRLSHLILPRGTRLSDGIGKLKSLRTLDGFSLAKSSLQNTKDLSELTNLADLNLIISREVYLNTILACADKDDTPEAAWMAALNSSMGKLGNLKRLSMVSFYECSRGDALSSFSPPFHNLEHLNLSGWFFSRVPKWVGVLRNLHSLELVVKEVMSESTCMEDVGIVGMLPSLVRLELRIPGIPRERIVIGSTGFAILKLLWVDCDAISYLTFEAGAMPKLWKLVLVVDSHGWDKATPMGLEHLLSLTQIEVWWARYYDTSADDETAERKISEKLIQHLFQLAVDALPSRPAFILHEGCMRRTRTRM